MTGAQASDVVGEAVAAHPTFKHYYRSVLPNDEPTEPVYPAVIYQQWRELCDDTRNGFIPRFEFRLKLLSLEDSDANAPESNALIAQANQAAQEILMWVHKDERIQVNGWIITPVIDEFTACRTGVFLVVKGTAAEALCETDLMAVFA